MNPYRKYEFPFLGKRILARRIKREGGAQVSGTLRRYYAQKHHTTVGLYSYGGCFSGEFATRGTVEIGNYCSIGPNVRYFGTNHPMHYATMSPYFYNRGFGYDVKDFTWSHLSVGHDVWIGCNTIMTCGCKSIGNGAVVGAGSVVTKDVEPYSVVAGNPAKKLKMRFDEAQIEALESSQWYTLAPDELMKHYACIEDPCLFAQSVYDGRQGTFKTGGIQL